MRQTSDVRARIRREIFPKTMRGANAVVRVLYVQHLSSLLSKEILEEKSKTGSKGGKRRSLLLRPLHSPRPKGEKTGEREKFAGFFRVLNARRSKRKKKVGQDDFWRFLLPLVGPIPLRDNLLTGQLKEGCRPPSLSDLF